MRFWPPLTEKQGMTALLRRAEDALSDLELALSTARVSVNRGRQTDATRMTLEAWRTCTLTSPGGSHATTTLARPGRFSKLARPFMMMVLTALPVSRPQPGQPIPDQSRPRGLAEQRS